MAKGDKKGGKKLSKKTLNKAKKVLGNKKMAKSKKGMDTFFQRCRSEGVLIPQQGVTVANYVFSSWGLLGEGADKLTNNAQFQQNALIYDKFRVNRLRIQIKPKANVMDAAGAQNDTAYNLKGSGVLHSVIDRDGTGPSSISQMVQRSSYRKTSVLKNMTRSYAVKYPTNVWLDCQSPEALVETARQLGLYGGVTIYAEDFIEDNYEVFNEPWAEYTIEWDVVFQGRAAPKTAFTLNEAGEVIGYTITRNEVAEQKPMTRAYSVRGTIRDTRLEDTVLSNNETVITHGEDQ